MSDLTWRKSSHSQVDCVEVAWATSTRSTGACVEVGRDGDRMLVRHSKDPHGSVLAFTRAEWEAFLAGVRNDEFDV